MRSMISILLLVCCAVVSAAERASFDYSHALWNTLLASHVHWTADGSTSKVDYVGLSRESAKLDDYLEQLSHVDSAAFNALNQNDRQAFLINAYNAATLQLILSRYPKLESIKDLGSLFSSPWKRDFVVLLGKTRSLDSIEHELLRGAADYSDPRIHFAVNCASIGCPALRPEAYVGSRLDAQLTDQTRRFLGDRSRNRYDAKSDRLEVSKLFDWYAGDFDDHAGGVAAFLDMHADALGLNESTRERLRQGKLAITFTDYDWKLNQSGQ
jgi:hypothetical protein